MGERTAHCHYFGWYRQVEIAPYCYSKVLGHLVNLPFNHATPKLFSLRGKELSRSKDDQKSLVALVVFEGSRLLILRSWLVTLVGHMGRSLVK